MRIFGTEIDEKCIVAFAAGSIFGGGFFYVAYKLLTRRKSGSLFVNRNNNNDVDCQVDLMLPVTLAREYGNCRKICMTADETASAFLKQIPEHFFQFQEKFARLVSTTLEGSRCTRALVIGSKTGALAFHLSKIFDQVNGVEPSFSKVATCYRLQNLESFVYHFPLEGSLKTQACTVQSPLVDANAESSPLKRRNKRKEYERIEFFNSDPSHVPDYIGEFELVVVNNCLNDIDDPVRFVSNLGKLVDTGGFLIISTDYDWKRSTNLESGFGTFQVKNSFELLGQILKSDFTFKEERYLEEAFCSSNRTCTLSNNHVTIWSKRDSDGKSIV